MFAVRPPAKNVPPFGTIACIVLFFGSERGMRHSPGRLRERPRRFPVAYKYSVYAIAVVILGPSLVACNRAGAKSCRGRTRLRLFCTTDNDLSPRAGAAVP